jgi:hypothetical protein
VDQSTLAPFQITNGTKAMNQLLNARLGKKYLFSCSVLLLSWQLTGCSDDTTADTTGPVITLNGNANIEVVFNAFFDDIGAQAVDDIDGEVPVTIEGTVDTSIPGTYELTYMAADSSGNTSELVRTVEVLSDPLLEASVSMPAPPIAFFFDGTLIGADYWSQEPQILSGGVGFSDILGVEADEELHNRCYPRSGFEGIYPTSTLWRAKRWCPRH